MKRIANSPSPRYIDRMGYKVAIKNNKTLEIRTAEVDGEFFPEWWSRDGSGGCDCNRANYFAQAGGEPYDALSGCGETGYSALWAELPDGKVVDIDE